MKSDKWFIFGTGVAIGLIIGLIVPKLFTVSSQVAAPPPPAFDTTAPTVNYEETIARLGVILKSDPGNYRALVDLGNAYFDSNRPAQAADAYAKALAVDGSSPDVHTDLGIMYRALQRPDAAVAEFRKAIALNPNHANSRLNLGVVLYYDLKDMKGAEQAWEEFLKIEPPGERADKIRSELQAMRQMMNQMDSAKKTGAPAPGAGTPPPPGGMPPLPPGMSPDLPAGGAKTP